MSIAREENSGCNCPWMVRLKREGESVPSAGASAGDSHSNAKGRIALPNALKHSVRGRCGHRWLPYTSISSVGGTHCHYQRKINNNEPIRSQFKCTMLLWRSEAQSGETEPAEGCRNTWCHFVLWLWVTEQAKQISSNQSTLALMAYTDGVTSLSFREDI